MREDIDLMRPFIEQQLLRVYEADSTRQVLKIVEDLMDGLEEVLDKDMLNTYFFLPELDYAKAAEQPLFVDEKKAPKLSDDITLPKNQTVMRISMKKKCRHGTGKQKHRLKASFNLILNTEQNQI